MSFSSKIIDWYQENKRELPWREGFNPYFTWLSEVILQQTRVNQGLPYYLKFIHHYPTVQELANATEDRVLKDWQGLGYYSRARNMHQAAKIIANKYNGQFPTEFNEILMLPGVGQYTASAISSICFNAPYPVIDGNVQRVLARIFGMTKPVNSTEGMSELSELLNQVFDKKRPGDFNQAMMEFGAIQCKPQNPGCDTCIFNGSCFALSEERINELPIKLKKAASKERNFIYVVPQFASHEFVVKRTSEDIWKNLYEFPLIEIKKRHQRFTQTTAEKIISELKLKGSIEFISPEFKHVLTHRIIYARFVVFKMNKGFVPPANWKKKPINDHSGFAFPVLIQKFLETR